MSFVADYLENLKDEIVDSFESLQRKVERNPKKYVINILLAVLLMFLMGRHAYQTYGFFALVGYLFACFKGITRAADKPGLTVVWVVGVFLGQVAFEILLKNAWPALQEGTAAGIFSALVIAYVAYSFYEKSDQMKNH